MKYREIYKALERRWRSSPGFRYSDFSGWRQGKQNHITISHPLWIVVEDRAAMLRIWITHTGTVMSITYVSMDEDGNNLGESHRIHCTNRTHMAQELERLLTGQDKAA